MEGNPAEAGTPVEEGIQAAGAAGSRRLAGAGRVADSRSWFSVSLCCRAMGRRVSRATKLLLSLPLCWVRCSARAVSTALGSFRPTWSSAMYLTVLCTHKSDSYD